MKLDKQQEAQAADSISSVGINVKEYAPSDVFTEPPPAYRKPRATAVQIARIAAFTVIACVTIIGFCLIAAAWIQANASCSNLIHTHSILHSHQQQVDESAADRPSYQALVDPLQSDESSESKQESLAIPLAHHKESNNNNNHNTNGPNGPTPTTQSQFDSQSTPIQIKLPLQLDFDEIAGSLMEKNERSRMNCVVEKKRAEEVMDHQPKTVRLPFGVNITTDPRYEHLTGERMAIYCESGNHQRQVPMESIQQQQQQPEPQPQPSAPMMMPMPMPMPMPMNMMNIPMMLPNGPQAGGPQLHGPMNHIPLSMITRASADESDSQKEDGGPMTIIAREEHIIPIFQQVIPELRPINSNSIEARNMPFEARGPAGEKMMYQPMSAEGRMLHTLAIPESRSGAGGSVPAVPSDMVRPPPPPSPPAFHKIPIHVPTLLQQVDGPLHQQLSENTLDDEPLQTDPRPHYVQPRSVRSVDPVSHPRDKRVRRYACECTC